MSYSLSLISLHTFSAQTCWLVVLFVALCGERADDKKACLPQVFLFFIVSPLHHYYYFPWFGLLCRSKSHVSVDNSVNGHVVQNISGKNVKNGKWAWGHHHIFCHYFYFPKNLSFLNEHKYLPEKNERDWLSPTGFSSCQAGGFVSASGCFPPSGGLEKGQLLTKKKEKEFNSATILL